MTSPPVFRDRRPVPVRTMLVAIGLLLATALLLYVVLQVTPGADLAGDRRLLRGGPRARSSGWVQRRLLGGKRRALATFLVFVVVFVVLAALVTAFVVPLVGEGTKLADGTAGSDRRGQGRAAGRSATCCSGRTPCSGCRTTRTRSSPSPAASPRRPPASSRASPPGSSGADHGHRAGLPDRPRGPASWSTASWPCSRRRPASGSGGSAPTAPSRSPATSRATC